MAELAREKADHDELKELAGDIITAQQREIDIIEAYFQGAHGELFVWTNGLWPTGLSCAEASVSPARATVRVRGL